MAQPIARSIVCADERQRGRVESGADSIAALGDATKAGAGCACQSEIGQLIVTLRKPAPVLEAAS